MRATYDTPTDTLKTPTPWRPGQIEVERTGKADGSYRLAFSIWSDTIAGEQDFTVGVIVSPEAILLAMTGLRSQPCEVRVSDVVNVEAAP